jgi:Holliday junction resolvase RusA-like endonuclease
MISITIDKKTPSINHLYGQKGFRKFIKPEGKAIREYIFSLFLNKPIDNKYYNTPLMVNVDIYENWLTKKDKVARKDVSNREKFLIDSVFMALGLDDKYIFYHTMKKVQSEKEKAIITIEVYP